MFCRKCGSQIEEGASFCKKCGTQVTVNKKSVKKQAVLVILIMQILQLLLYFAPVFKLDIPAYGEGTVKIVDVWYDLVEDFYINANGLRPTATIILFSVVAIISTVLLLMDIYQGALIGHIIRFVSWLWISFVYVGAWALLVDFSQQATKVTGYFGADVGMKTLFLGVIYHFVNIALFAVLVIVTPQVIKLKTRG